MEEKRVSGAERGACGKEQQPTQHARDPAHNGPAESNAPAKPRNSSAVEKFPHAAVSAARLRSAHAMHPPTMPSPRRPEQGDLASSASHVAQSTPGFAAAMRGSEGSHGWLLERYAGIPVSDALSWFARKSIVVENSAMRYIVVNVVFSAPSLPSLRTTVAGAAAVRNGTASAVPTVTMYVAPARRPARVAAVAPRATRATTRCPSATATPTTAWSSVLTPGEFVHESEMESTLALVPRRRSVCGAPTGDGAVVQAPSPATFIHPGPHATVASLAGCIRARK